MTNWTLIAGGRCADKPWCVGIAGFDVQRQQAFALSEANWARLQQQIPLEPLATYGKSNGLPFERVADAIPAPTYDGLLLIALDRQDQPAVHPATHCHLYLQLREENQRATLGDAHGFAKIFLPMALSNFDEKWMYLDPSVMADPAHPKAEWRIAREPHENDHSRLFHRSADFWIHRITAAIAADAAAQRAGKPLLSVLIPTYNHGRFLRQCVQSVLDQGLDDIEILVLDNASTDETPQVMEGFAREPRVRYMRNRYNYGPGYNWENGLWIAQGRYFTFLSADDYFNPGHLARLLPMLQAHPEVAVGYTGIRWVDGEDAPLAQPRHSGYRPADYVGGRNEVADLLIHDNYMAPSAVIYRREAFCQTWRPVKNSGGGDWDMAIQMAERFPDFAYADTPGVSYRWHGAQYSQQFFYTSAAPLEDHLAITEGVLERGAQHHLKGREHEVSDHIERRLALYPDEWASPLGERARSLVKRLQALAEESAAPMFSIVLTTYNRPTLLADALASIDRQTLRDFEVILVNDHGESVAHLLSGYGFPIAYLLQARNRGPAAARNAGHRLARGRYLVYLDDDDLFLPEHLHTLANALQEHPAEVVYSDAIVVIEKLEGTTRMALSEEKRYPHDTYSRDRLCVDNYIPINTFAWPRAFAMEVGGFDEHLPALEDWDFLLRLAAKVSFHHVRQETVQVRMRIHGDLRRSQQAFKDYPALYKKIYLRHPVADNPEVHQARKELLETLAARHRAPITLTEWLVQRSPGKVQSQLIAQHFANDFAKPSLAIFIRTASGAGDVEAVVKSLQSLERLQGPYAPQQIFVLGEVTAEPRENLPQLQFIKSGDDREQLSDINRLVETSNCDWVLTVDAGDEFTSSGLLITALELAAATHCRAACADELVRTQEGTLGSMFRPAFNLDMLLSCPMGMARHWFFRSNVFIQAGGFDPTYADAPEFELLLRLIEQAGIEGLGHVDEPLLIAPSPSLAPNGHERAAIEKHLRMRGYENAAVDASMPGRYRIHYGHTDSPLVSVIISTKDQFALVQRCVETLLENTTYEKYEILIADNNSTAKDACIWLDSLEAMGSNRVRVLRYPHPVSHSAIHNMAAREARGEYLLLLNNGTAVLKEDWLDAMLNHALRPEVGIVGAKLLSSDGHIDHAGLVLGLRGPAGTPFAGLKNGEPGYMQRLEIDQNYNAVTGACLMIRRALYEQVGGLDETNFKLSGNDIDLCLKVREAGYLIVWTPHAVLLHEGNPNRNQEAKTSLAAQKKHLIDEHEALFRKWLPAITCDTAYNQNLSLHGTGFEVEFDHRLNWNPLAWRPLPVLLALPADLAGCGHYRIIHPTTAMADTGLADARLSERHYTPVEIERLQPDAIVLQRQVGDLQIELIRRNYQFRQTFKVAELDDYLPNVPLKSMHRSHIPQDIMRSLRRTVALADRLVVSTPALADALAGLHPDTHVIQNRLPLAWWNELAPSLRRQNRRPRVGWAGGSGHQGDLELIADIVKALAHEVDWVFFGMCPEQMRPYVHEFHHPVPIDRYAQKLASLNLDLALAPLEANLFNECKSNLRLLEYGVCGYPVVCSDVRPYQGSLPVTRVKNRFKDWMDAIRAHTSDLDASARAGDQLRETVRSNWMLEGQHLQHWLNAWLGH